MVRSVVLGRHVSFSLMTSRTQGLANTLRAPGRFESRTVLPTGDCFYDCMHMLLPKERPAGLKEYPPWGSNPGLSASFPASPLAH